MDKLPLTGRNPSRVFNSRSGRVHVLQLHFSETEQPNLKLKTWPEQQLDYLPLVIVLSVVSDGQMSRRAFFLCKMHIGHEQRTKKHQHGPVASSGFAFRTPG